MTHSSVRANGATAGVLWAAATAGAYSSWAIVGKSLLADLGLPSMLLWRFGIASVVLWAMLLVRRPAQGRRVPQVHPLVSLALGAVYGMLLFLGFMSIERVDVSVYVVILYLYPVLVVVASSLLGHRTAPLTWVALALVLVGVVLTVPELFGRNGGIGAIDGLGVAFVVIQAVLYAGFLVVNGRLIPAHADGTVTAAWTVLGATLVVAPIALVEGLVVPDSRRMIVEVVMFALVPTVIANVCFYRALRRVSPSVVAMIMTLEIALVILWSVLFVGERPDAIQYAGAAVVVVAVVLAQQVARSEVPEVGPGAADPRPSSVV